jgi:hypothetical protein
MIRTSNYNNAYLYSHIGRETQAARATIGFSLDDLRQGLLVRREACPKLGVSISSKTGTLLRAAAFKSVRRQLVSNQTLEPTQISGFNQFFDDVNGARAWRYGAAHRSKA